MTKILAAIALAISFVVSLVSDAEAFGRRCGDFIQNGTIYVASRVRDCDRGTAWQHGSHGRYWGGAPRQRAYYKPQYPAYYRPAIVPVAVPVAAPFVAQPVAVASPAPVTQNTGWSNQGKNALCAGKPKFTAFACTSPSTGRQTTCYCD